MASRAKIRTDKPRFGGIRTSQELRQRQQRRSEQDELHGQHCALMLIVLCHYGLSTSLVLEEGKQQRIGLRLKEVIQNKSRPTIAGTVSGKFSYTSSTKGTELKLLMLLSDKPTDRIHP